MKNLTLKFGIITQSKRVLSAIFRLVLLLIIGIPKTEAQSALNATGGHKTIAGNHYAFSIGEMTLVNTATSPTLVVTQGLLQPQETNDGSAVNDMLIPADALSVYPNPFDAAIYLKTRLKHGGQLSVRVFDALGRQVAFQEWKVTSGTSQFSLNLSSLAAGFYTLQAQIRFQQKQAVQNFKIQKIH